MVKPITPIKSKHFLKRELFLAITSIVVAFLFLSNLAFAAEMKISSQEVERIKIALDIIKTTSNFGGLLIDGGNGGNLKTILSTMIKGGETATDVTYGLLVLSALNEMEFMDMVLSQDYKDKARDYFNQILDERTNLRSYWKGVGFDIPKVVSGRITSPIAALTLNTFEMTDKIILIFSVFKNLQTELRYDGLWYYFDFRRGGDSHEDAWNFARWHMQWAGSAELESQFSSLYEKWSPYATPHGISKEYKEQLASELRNTLASAIEENTPVSPVYVERPSLWDKFSAQLANIKNAVANIISQVKNPFSAGPIVELPPEIPAEVPVDIPVDIFAENGPPPTSLNEDKEPVVELEQATAPKEPTTTEPTTTEPTIEALEPEPTPAPKEEVVAEVAEAEVAEARSPQTLELALCQKKADAAKQYRVLINEVAWMGNQDSSNNEWIELKNIWGIPISLNGWQLQDKDQQIKVIFDENDVIPVLGYYLLERTDDNSLPDAPADKIYTGALSNNNEAIYLFDNNCQLEDEIVANPNWPGGDNSLKKTMQRFDVLYWYTGAVSARSENSPPPAILSHPSASAPASTKAQEKSSYFPKIIITETYTGSPGNQKDDFVELYNPNSEPVSLTDWYIQRKTETGQDFSSYAPAGLFFGKTIQAKSYFLIANASSSLSAELINASTTYSLTENNTLVLKNPSGEIVDQISTAIPPSSKSHGRKWLIPAENYADNFENQKPTPKAQNQSSASEDEGEEEGEASALSVVINEIAWMGTKAKSQDEWIELYNNTTSSINLAGWRLAADDGGPDITFPTSTIPAKGYFLIERTDDTTVSNVSADQIYTGALSNEGMILELYDNLGNLIDSVDTSSGWPAGNNQTKQTMERINSASSSDASNWASNNRISKNGRDAENNYINGTPKVQNSVSKSFTEVAGGLDIYENFTLTYLGSPYSMLGQLYVRPNVKLIIEPGVVVKFKNNPYWQSLFKVEGQLEATGVTFTSSSTEPLAGDWQGMHFKENSSSTLDNVVIKYADTVKIDGGQVSIKNSTIEKSQSYGLWIINSSPEISSSTFLNNDKFYYTSGIYVGDASSTPVIASSTFTGNKIGITAENGAKPRITGNVFKENEYPIKVSSAYPYLSGNSAQNNTNGDSVFFTGAIFQDAVWQANLPYIVENTLIITDGAKLTIEPGTLVKLRGDSKILVNGTLSAQGGEGNQIIFTSITDSDPENNGGYYIYFNPSSQNSVLNNVIVRYGGYHINDFAGCRAAVTIENSSLAISNSIIENSFFAGIHLINSTSTIQNTVFRDNKIQYSWWGYGSYSRGLSILNSELTIAGSHFERNYHGIYIEGGCPDLSGAIFGSGDDANTFNVTPENCMP